MPAIIRKARKKVKKRADTSGNNNNNSAQNDGPETCTISKARRLLSGEERERVARKRVAKAELDAHEAHDHLQKLQAETQHWRNLSHRHERRSFRLGGNLSKRPRDGVPKQELPTRRNSLAESGRELRHSGRPARETLVALQNSSSKGNVAVEKSAFEDSASEVGNGDDDDEDGESSELPVLSVTGYPTPRLIVHPNAPNKVTWDIVVGVLIVYSVIAVPLRVGFDVRDSFGIILSDIVVDSLFGVDCILTFRTAFFDERLGGLETNPWKIAKRYLKGFFAIDFFSTIPVEECFMGLMWLVAQAKALGTSKDAQGNQSSAGVGGMAKLLKVFRMARLLKILRLAKLGSKGSARPENDPRGGRTIRAFGSMFGIVFFVAHLMACTWYFALDHAANVNWLTDFFGTPHAADDLSLWDKYVVSAYWAITTMTTVGFGDIVATNSGEYLVILFGMLVGASMFGFVIGTVSELMDRVDIQAATHKEKLDQLKMFIIDRGIFAPIGHRIKKHFLSVYKRTTVFDNTSAELASQLPATAACAVVYAQYRNIVLSIPFLKNSPPMLVKEVLQYMKPFVAKPGESIARANDLGFCLFFLESGSATQYLELSSSTKRALRSTAMYHEDDEEVKASDGSSPSSPPASSSSVKTPNDRRVQSLTFAMARPLGFELESELSSGGTESGRLVVASVEPGGQAEAAGLTVGQRLISIGGEKVASLDDFNAKCRKRRNTCNLVFKSLLSEWLKFSRVESGAMFGEAAVILNTPHYVTTVANESSDAWFLPKEDLLLVLEYWPRTREDMAYNGRMFLSRVLDAYEQYGEANCPACVADMVPHAQESDLVRGEGDGDDVESFLGCDSLIQTMLSGSAHTPRTSSSVEDDDEETVALDAATVRLAPEDSGSFKQMKVMSPRTLTTTTGLIHPNSRRKMLWDVSVSLVIIYSVITITYQLGFGQEFSGTLANIDILVDCIFTLDILLTFNGAVIDKDELLVTDRRKIAYLYLRGWFPIDFITTFPIDRVVLAANDGDGNSAVLRSVKLIRAIRLVRLIKIIQIVVKSGFFEKVEDILGVHPAILRFVKVVVIMCFFAHLFACVLYAMSTCNEATGMGCWKESYCVGAGAWDDDSLYDDTRNPKGEGECLAEMDSGLQYIVALYWSVTTMTSIGYGDITPQPTNTLELVCTIVVQILGTTVFAYVVGNIVSIVIALNLGVRMKRENMVVLNLFMTEFRCTFSFRRAVRMHYIFQQRVKGVFDDAKLLGELPPDLRIQAVAFIHARQIVPKVPLLCALEADMRGVFTLLLPRLRPYNFSRGNALFHPATGANRELYFLTSGAVQCTIPRRAAAASPAKRSDGEGLSSSSSTSPSSSRPQSPRSHNEPSLDRSTHRSGSVSTYLKRYEAGDYFGEVPLLIPEEVRFSVRVEVRCVTDSAQAFGLRRLEYSTLKMYYPQLTAEFALLCKDYFEENFHDWVTVPSKDFDYEDMAYDIGLRQRFAEDVPYVAPPESKQLPNEQPLDARRHSSAGEEPNPVDEPPLFLGGNAGNNGSRSGRATPDGAGDPEVIAVVVNSNVHHSNGNKSSGGGIGNGASGAPSAQVTDSDSEDNHTAAATATARTVSSKDASLDISVVNATSALGGGPASTSSSLSSQATLSQQQQQQQQQEQQSRRPPSQPCTPPAEHTSVGVASGAGAAPSVGGASKRGSRRITVSANSVTGSSSSNSSSSQQPQRPMRHSSADHATTSGGSSSSNVTAGSPRSSSSSRSNPPSRKSSAYNFHSSSNSNNGGAASKQPPFSKAKMDKSISPSPRSRTPAMSARLPPSKASSQVPRTENV